MVLALSICARSDTTGLRAQVDMDGYALIPGYATGRSTERIAAELGEPLSPWGGALVQELTPKGSSTPNTYSGLFGLDRFPFHTDLAHWPLPPRYLVLRCVLGYADLPTLMLDGRVLASEIGSEVLARALVRPRRPRGGKIQMLRLQQSHDSGEIIRWDEVFLKPASPVGELAFSSFQCLIAKSATIPATMTNDGDILVIDNWRMLHARPAISQGRKDRRLQRVYLRRLA